MFYMYIATPYICRYSLHSACRQLVAGVLQVIAKRLLIQGFIVGDYLPTMGAQFKKDMSQVRLICCVYSIMFCTVINFSFAVLNRPASQLSVCMVHTIVPSLLAWAFRQWIMHSVYAACTCPTV